MKKTVPEGDEATGWAWDYWFRFGTELSLFGKLHWKKVLTISPNTGLNNFRGIIIKAIINTSAQVFTPEIWR